LSVLEIDTTERIAGNSCQTEEEQHGVPTPTPSALVFVEELSERHHISVHSRLFKPLEPHIMLSPLDSDENSSLSNDRKPKTDRRQKDALVMVKLWSVAVAAGGGWPAGGGKNPEKAKTAIFTASLCVRSIAKLLITFASERH
jgi:hypothetical protein